MEVVRRVRHRGDYLYDPVQLDVLAERPVTFADAILDVVALGAGAVAGTASLLT